MASSAHGVPLDLHVVYGLLEQAGVTDFDPQVLTQLVEYRNRAWTSLEPRSSLRHLRKRARLVRTGFVQGRISETLIRIDTGAPVRACSARRSVVPISRLTPHTLL